jgi:predicted small lipoprotein YifL
MLSHKVTITTSRALRAAVAAVIVALTLNGCGFTGPDPAACKAALQAEYVKATAGKGHFNPDPPACKGLPKAQVQQFAQQVLEGK